MATNLVTYLLDADATRNAEYPGTPFSGGGNLAGSCAPGVGINTGNYDPKAQDWPRIADTAARQSQHIGDAGIAPTVTAPIQVAQGQDGAGGGTDLNDNVAFVTNPAPVAPDAELDATTGAINKTGGTVPANSWTWGLIVNV